MFKLRKSENRSWYIVGKKLFCKMLCQSVQRFSRTHEGVSELELHVSYTIQQVSLYSIHVYCQLAATKCNVYNFQFILKRAWSIKNTFWWCRQNINSQFQGIFELTGKD